MRFTWFFASTHPSQMQPRPAAPSRKRVLWFSCVAHALHDGYTDTIYVLLPVWQADFALSYGALALLRSMYSGTMACLQIPAGRLAKHLGSRATLALGTVLAACGYAVAGMSGSLLGLCMALAISGVGSSTQHPIASGAVSRVYGRNARGPLSIYNFAGDLGKSALPAAVSLLVTMMPWRHALWLVSVLGCLVAAAIALFLPTIPRAAVISETDKALRPDTVTAIPSHISTEPAEAARSADQNRNTRAGFSFLFMIGVLDSAVRMGLLTFLPFLLKAKGVSPSMLGTALALVFIGGAAGKFACGWLGARLGVIGTTLATEGGTALCIIAVMFAPLSITMVLLPLLGVMLNGTSSVLYGTVPDLAPPDGTERAFALFYTGTIASGAISPVIYGFLGDHMGVNGATFITAMTALAIFPFAIALRSRLPSQR